MRDITGGKYFYSERPHRQREQAHSIRLALWESHKTGNMSAGVSSICFSQLTVAQWFGPNWPNRG